MIFNAYANQAVNVMGVSIVSCGHVFAKNGRKIDRPNGRVDWLLFYVAKECETFYLNEEKVDAPAGSFVIFKPYERQQHVYLGDKTAEFYYVHFMAGEEFDLLGFKTSIVYTVKPSAAICSLFEEMVNEVQLKQPCYEALCVFKMMEILSLLKRKVIDLNIPHKEYYNKIAFVIQIMNREYFRNDTLEDYAQMCQLSKFHFLRKFEEITGMTPIAYRNKIRMEHARELLQDTTMPINEIGSMVGYDSQPYFCDAFKKEAGLSPAQFRKVQRQEVRFDCLRYSEGDTPVCDLNILEK